MLRKIITLTLLLIFCLPSLALADGINDQQAQQYVSAGAVDYKTSIVRQDNIDDKPLAGFQISIQDSSGTIKAISQQSPKGFDVTDPAAMVTANVGDTLSFIDCSSASDGNSLNLWDFQHKYLNQGQDPTSIGTTANYYSSSADVTQAVQSIKLDKPGELRLYLAVQDNAPCVPGAENWSANGNLRVEKTDDPHFLKGILWYFSEVFVTVLPAPPDFYSTPEGSDTWQESYKNPNICAKTYADVQPGQQFTFPITLRNSGTEDITDFQATWSGLGKDPLKGWNKEQVPFNAGKIDLKTGESKTFQVTVTVPQKDEENRLVFLCNLDGGTPATEQNKDNNMTIIRIGNPGVDLAIDLMAPQDTYTFRQGSIVVPPSITARVYRKDGGTNTVKATLSWETPEEPGSEAFDVTPGYDQNWPIPFSADQAGEYTITAQVWPKEATDIYPIDNTDSLKIRIQIKSDAAKDNNDTGGLIVGLGGN